MTTEHEAIGPVIGRDGDLTLADVQRERQRGKEMAELGQTIMGEERQFLVMGYEVYPNGTTSDPITDRETANLIGRQFGLGPTYDPAGFAIWAAPDQVPWHLLRKLLEAVLESDDRNVREGRALPVLANRIRSLLLAMSQIEMGQIPGEDNGKDTAGTDPV